ncbi:MAG: hypothetical protein J6V72_06235 [Kiritimatiellae bacterium]|nr:hypothetical protein [Kiritimatiellia bacterium]
MKPHEILSMLPQWADAAPEALLDSPAWAMPCRLGEDSAALRAADVRPGDTLDLAVLLDGERHVLSIADSPRFTDVHALWPSRADVPEPILLALVEKECGSLLQLVENAVRRQLKIEGLAPDGPDGRTLFAQVNDVVFGLTRSPTVEAAFGQLRFIDCAHQAVRDTVLPCETELAAFTLPAADLASLAVGDALLLPEVGTVPPRLVVAGRFVVDENGVLPFKDDGRLRVVGAQARTLTLGELFDRAQNPAAEESAAPAQLCLVASGRAAARGRLERLASHPAFVVESL